MTYLYKVLITLMLVASHSVGTEIEGKDGGIKFISGKKYAVFYKSKKQYPKEKKIYFDIAHVIVIQFCITQQA